MKDIGSTSPFVFSVLPRSSCAKVTGAGVTSGFAGEGGAGVGASSSMTPVDASGHCDA